MPSSNLKFFDRFLRLVHTIGDHYGSILLGGLLLVGGIALIGYVLGEDKIMLWAAIGAVVFVLGPPAVLMSAFLISSLWYKFKSSHTRPYDDDDIE